MKILSLETNIYYSLYGFIFLNFYFKANLFLFHSVQSNFRKFKTLMYISVFWLNAGHFYLFWVHKKELKNWVSSKYGANIFCLTKLKIDSWMKNATKNQVIIFWEYNLFKIKCLEYNWEFVSSVNKCILN